MITAVENLKFLSIELKSLLLRGIEPGKLFFRGIVRKLVVNFDIGNIAGRKISFNSILVKAGWNDLKCSNYGMT
jgi:hypothetical protein